MRQKNGAQRHKDPDRGFHIWLNGRECQDHRDVHQLIEQKKLGAVGSSRLLDRADAPFIFQPMEKRKETDTDPTIDMKIAGLDPGDGEIIPGENRIGNRMGQNVDGHPPFAFPFPGGDVIGLERKIRDEVRQDEQPKDCHKNNRAPGLGGSGVSVDWSTGAPEPWSTPLFRLKFKNAVPIFWRWVENKRIRALNVSFAWFIMSQDPQDFKEFSFGALELLGTEFLDGFVV
jgi:hypothetical protein